MSQITVPSTLTLDNQRIHYVMPGQIVHKSRYTQRRQVLERDPGGFVGVARFIPTMFDDQGPEAEAFFSQMEHRGNWCELQTARPTIPDMIVPAMVDSTAIVDDRLRVTFTENINGEIGYYVRINQRLHQLTKPRDAAGLVWELEPNHASLAPNGANVTPTEKIRASMVGENPMLTRASGIWGPWDLQWEERIV